MSAPIQIVDEQDRPAGQATKQEAWKKGLWHRVVRTMLEDGKGNVLLQLRSPTKDIYPNCWDSSSAGHVDAGEDYLGAMRRELKEELGIEGLQLEELGDFADDHVWNGLIMRRFVHAYRAVITYTPKHQEPDKIAEVRWWKIDDVKRLLKEHPDRAADGLHQVFERYY